MHGAKEMRVVLIEDNVDLALQILSYFDNKKINVNHFSEAEDYLGCARDNDLIMCDHRLPGMSGLDALAFLNTKNLDITFIMITGYADVQLAIQAIKNGASEFVQKPIMLDELFQLFRKYYDPKSDNQKNENPFDYIIRDEESPIKDLLRIIRSVGNKNIPVILHGESGTGKELFAKALHDSSGRPHDGFIGVNCGAIDNNMMMSELFGHKKGAFTGAHQDREGKFSLAHGGTLFLDEVADMPLSMQTALLRVLQEKKYAPLGANTEKDSDFKLVCASHKSLENEVRKGNFREDLYYRLNGLILEIPPLRERKSDIKRIADFFWQGIHLDSRKKSELSEEEYECLLSYKWPGNIRQLKSILESYSVYKSLGLSLKKLLTDKEVKSDIIENASDEASANTFLKRPLRNVPLLERKKLILETMESVNQNKSEAAKILGVSRGSLVYQLKKINIE